MNSKIGPYIIIEELSTGGFGNVYKVKHQQSGAFHALKVLHKKDDMNRKRFMKEVNSLAQLEHPNIVRIYDYNIENDQPWLSMEFIQGNTLTEYYRQNTLSPRASAKMLYILLNVMEYVHAKGVIHRDIKPKNIMITDEGHMKLADFGIAKHREYASDELTKSHEMLGTLYYMSPEQTKKSQDVDERTDIYSTGAVLYFMMTGASPHEGVNQFDSLKKILNGNIRSPREINTTIPRSLESICYKALALNPEERYQTCDDFREDIKRFLQNERVSVASKRIYDFQRIIRKYKKRIIGTGVVGVGLFTGIYSIIQSDLDTLDRINNKLKVQQFETKRLLNQLEGQSVKINADQELIKIHDNTGDKKLRSAITYQEMLELYEKCSNKSLGSYIIGKHYEDNIKQDSAALTLLALAVHCYLRSFELNNNNYIAKQKIMEFATYDKQPHTFDSEIFNKIAEQYKFKKVPNSNFFVILNSYPNLFESNIYMRENYKILADEYSGIYSLKGSSTRLKKLNVDEKKLYKNYPTMVLLGLYYDRVEKNHSKALSYFRDAIEENNSLLLYHMIADSTLDDIKLKRALITDHSTKVFEIFRYNQAIDYFGDIITKKKVLSSTISSTLKNYYVGKVMYFVNDNNKLKAKEVAREFAHIGSSTDYLKVSGLAGGMNDIITLFYYAEYYDKVVQFYERGEFDALAFREITHPSHARGAYKAINQIYESYQHLKLIHHPFYEKRNEQEFLRRVVNYGGEVKESLQNIQLKERERKHALMAKLFSIGFKKAHSKYVKHYNDIKKEK